MFTGLVEEVGEVLALELHEHQNGTATARITVAAPGLGARLKTGDSVSVSGVCLTALEPLHDRFSADLAAETVARTNLAALEPGSRVNLELPLPAGTPLGGHIVQGHVDGTGRLLSLTPAGGATADAADPADSGAHDWLLVVEVPSELLRYIVHKGSITIEGISLTVAALDENRVTVAIIPHTYRATNLHALKPDSRLNIEVDVLAKYAERLEQTRSHSEPLTVERLMRLGF